MLIVQMSDLHLAIPSPNLTGVDCRRAILAAVSTHRRDDEALVIAVCGDLVSRGRTEQAHFVEAFLADLIGGMPSAPRVFIVPGNHDIDTTRRTEAQFAHIDHIAQFLGERTRYSAGEFVAVGHHSGADFIFMNSAFHRDHTYGHAPLEALDDLLQHQRVQHGILITHHHLLRRADRQAHCSAITNTYEFLMKVKEYGVSLVMHGHQHAASAFRVTEQAVPVVGAGSLYSLGDAPNTNNQFNVIGIRDGRVEEAYTYRLLADANTGGRLQAFVPLPLEIL